MIYKYFKYTTFISVTTLCLLGVTQLAFAKTDEFPGMELYPVVGHNELAEPENNESTTIVVELGSVNEHVMSVSSVCCTGAGSKFTG